MQGNTRFVSERGFAMAALLVALSVMAVVMTMLLPAWQTMARREREAELAFRGAQYAKAIERYQRARGAFPPSIDVLVRERFLRKKYKDPMVADGEFQVIRVGQPMPGQTTPPPADGRSGQPRAGQVRTPAEQSGQRGSPPPQSGFQQVTRAGETVGGGPIIGVVSRSTDTSLRLFNGRNKYNEWPFVPIAATQQGGAGAGATATPGGPSTATPGLGQGRGTARPGGPGAGTGSGLPRGGSMSAPLQLPSRGDR
jgi:type II secretory pathway pseudopilin PulG